MDPPGSVYLVRRYRNGEELVRACLQDGLLSHGFGFRIQLSNVTRAAGDVVGHVMPPLTSSYVGKRRNDRVMVSQLPQREHVCTCKKFFGMGRSSSLSPSISLPSKRVLGLLDMISFPTLCFLVDTDTKGIWRPPKLPD